MTRDEAAAILHELWSCDYHYCLSTNDAMAVDMAIEALEQPEIRYCKDCMYYDRDTGHCDMHTMMTDPDDYCSYSVRR